MRYSGEHILSDLIAEVAESLSTRAASPRANSRLSSVDKNLRTALPSEGPLHYFVYPPSGDEELYHIYTRPLGPVNALGRASLIVSTQLAVPGTWAYQGLDRVHMQPLRPGASGRPIQQLNLPLVNVGIPPQNLSEILVVGYPDVKNLILGGHVIHPQDLWANAGGAPRS